jgi:hypothetical protein
MVKTEEDLIWESYVQEAVVPFDKRREIRKGMAKKHGKKILKPYTFGFDIEFSVELDEESIAGMLEWNQFDVHPHQEDYVNWVEEEKIYDNEPDYENVSDWEDDHEEPDEDDFTSNRDLIDEDDYEDDDDYVSDHDDAFDKDQLEYEAAHAKWEQDKRQIEDEISNWYAEKEYHLENSGDEFIQHLIDSGEWKGWVNVDSGEIDYEIDEIRREINDALEDHKPDDEDYDDEELMGWDVSEDEARNYEVTSPILTTKDIPMVIDVLNVIGGYGTASDQTSAHVHIGIPDDFDFFDLMGLYDLMDEEKVQGAFPDRENYAASKKKFLRKIFFKLIRYYKDGDTIDFSDIKDIGMEKHMGVNISGVSGSIAKRKKGEKVTSGVGKTVEFRYLSSEIFDNSTGVEEFLEWIDYFMMLMKLAQRRNQFTIRGVSGGGSEPESIKLTRVNKDQFRFNVGKARMPYEKPSDLKQKEGQNNDFYEYVKYNEKVYNNSTSNNFQEKHPKPDFKNMSKQDMDEWWLSTPEHAYQYLTNERTYKGNEKYLERALDDYRVGGELIKNTRYNVVVLPKRLPKLEYILMYKKPKGEREDYDSLLLPIVMTQYLEKLQYDDVISFEEFMNFKGKQKESKFKDGEDFKEVQDLFRRIIHNIKPKEDES